MKFVQPPKPKIISNGALGKKERWAVAQWHVESSAADGGWFRLVSSWLDLHEAQAVLKTVKGTTS